MGPRTHYVGLCIGLAVLCRRKYQSLTVSFQYGLVGVSQSCSCHEPKGNHLANALNIARFTFPLGVFTTAVDQFAKEMPSTFFKVLGTVMNSTPPRVMLKAHARPNRFYPYALPSSGSSWPCRPSERLPQENCFRPRVSRSWTRWSLGVGR